MKYLDYFLIMAMVVILISLFFKGGLKDTFVAEDNSNDISRIRERLMQVDDIKSIVEGIKFDISDGNTYCEDKETIYFCTRDANDKVYDDNTLIYAALHELAHVITKSIGHTHEFYDNFDKLLELATIHRIYNPCIPIAKEYCGVDIPTTARIHRDKCNLLQKIKN